MCVCVFVYHCVYQCVYQWCVAAAIHFLIPVHSLIKPVGCIQTRTGNTAARATRGPAMNDVD